MSKLIDKLNELIQQETPLLHVIEKKNKIGDMTFVNYQLEIVPNKYIDHKYHILNVTDEFTEDIEEFFKDEGFNMLSWNNTRTTFWITI